jgi:hypothetical protein
MMFAGAILNQVVVKGLKEKRIYYNSHGNILIHLIHKANRAYSNDDTDEERLFRERYAQELQKKMNQPDARSYSQDDEMAEERRKVSHQQGKTPGRKGEEIKQEEIDKEIVRRNRLQQKKNKKT